MGQETGGKVSACFQGRGYITRTLEAKAGEVDARTAFWTVSIERERRMTKSIEGSCYKD
jgi:hypothetical protein